MKPFLNFCFVFAFCHRSLKNLGSNIVLGILQVVDLKYAMSLGVLINLGSDMSLGVFRILMLGL